MGEPAVSSSGAEAIPQQAECATTNQDIDSDNTSQHSCTSDDMTTGLDSSALTGWKCIQLTVPANAELPPECRICLASEPCADLICPCACTGTVRHVHHSCLKLWALEKRSLHCELCGSPYDNKYAQPMQQLLDANPLPERSPHEHVSLDMHGIPRPLRHHRERGLLVEQPMWGWHCLWVYALCILLLVFAAVYTEVWHQSLYMSSWTLSFWRILVYVLPVYIMLRFLWDLYRFQVIKLPYGPYSIHRMERLQRQREALAAETQTLDAARQRRRRHAQSEARHVLSEVQHARSPSERVHAREQRQAVRLAAQQQDAHEQAAAGWDRSAAAAARAAAGG